LELGSVLPFQTFRLKGTGSGGLWNPVDLPCLPFLPKGDFAINTVMAAGACFLGYKLTAERHAEIRHKLDLLDVSETDPGAAAEALTGVDLGPKGRP
jgi:hypothetical protein